MHFLSDKLRTYAIALITGIATLWWIQASLINWDYGVLTGVPIPWEAYRIRLILDTLLWTGGILFFLRSAHIIRKNLAFICLTLLSAQLIMLLPHYLEARKFPPSFQNFSLSEEGKMDFNPKKNIVIIMLDAFQADIFQEIMDRHPEYRDYFEGFTWFRNTTSQYSKTYGAVPALLTGLWYENHMPVQNFLQESFKNSLSTRLTREGWMTHLYPVAPRIIGYDTAFASNIIMNTNPERNARDAGKMMDIALFRSSPQFLKPFWLNDMRWRIQNHMGAAFIRESSEEPAHEKIHYFHPVLQFTAESQSILNAGSKKPTFKFFHFNIPHEPFVLNPALQQERQPGNREGFLTYSMAALEAVHIFIEGLKRTEIFDETLLFILSDHGGGEYNPGVGPAPGLPHKKGDIRPKHHASGLPLLMAKEFGATGPMQTSDAPASLGDVPPTIAAKLWPDRKNPYEGKNLFELNEDEERTRRYLYYEFSGWEQHYLPEMKEYSIEGHAFSPASWKATGRTFPPAYTGKTFKSNGASLPEEILETYCFKNTHPEGILLEGWSGPEPHGTWSERKKVRIRIPAETDETLKIRMQLAPYTCGGTLESQRIILREGQNILRKWFVDKKEEYIFTTAGMKPGPEKEIILELELPDAVSPSACGSGKDGRLLGVNISKLCIEKITAEVEPGTSLTFGYGQAAEAISGMGWHHPEAKHRWTGGQASLIFSLAEKRKRDLRLTLMAHPFLYTDITEQSVLVHVNGVETAEWKMAQTGWYEATIPSDLAEDTMEILFSISHPASPADIGVSLDPRKLGMAVYEMRLEYED
ncbi:sulfatase-like hydrolase/transferase [Desulfobotulus alkaliphilus]|nr:sulfatase-like hydrolase/transferase [Desulfobotulus alkaliphilus]